MRCLNDLARAEGEQLPGEIVCTLGRRRDRLDLARRLRIAVHVGLQQGGVAVDDGEQIVEVVGDATGELPERIHLL